MKKYLLILTLIAFVFVMPAVAQKKPKKSKEEVAMEKEWAKKLKTLKPLDYKKLLEDKDALSSQVSELESKNSSIRTELDTKDSEIARLKKELEDYKTGVVPGVEGGGDSTGTGKTTGVTRKKGPSKGVVYKVQIGSFRNKDLSKYFDNNPNFSGDIDPDGTKKYTLGAFTDYWEADKFKKALREMGVKGAWIVAYKNGQRVNVKDALEGSL